MNPLLQDFLLGVVGGITAWVLLQLHRRPIRFRRRRSTTDFKIETIMELLYDTGGVFDRLEKLETIPDVGLYADKVRIVTFVNRYLLQLEKEVKEFCNENPDVSIIHSSVSSWTTGQDVQDTLWYVILHYKTINHASATFKIRKEEI